jgi:hypothetical protein
MSFGELLPTNGSPAQWPLGYQHKLMFLGDYRENHFRNPLDGSRTPGVEIHATAVANLLDHSYLRVIPVVWQILFILVWGVSLAIFLCRDHSLRRYLSVLSATVCLVAVSILLQLYGNFWWWWLIPVGFQMPVALLTSAIPSGFVAFISYSTSDGELVAVLLEEGLRARGCRAYFAPGSIQAGVPFPASLLKHVRQAPVFLLVLTNHSRQELRKKGSWVYREVSEALRPGRWPLAPPKLMLIVRFRTKPLNAAELPASIRLIADLQEIEFEGGPHTTEVIDKICCF